MQIMQEALLETGRGLIDDHYSRFNGDRQVTLIQSENLATIASHLGKDEALPQDLRRNIVTQGINLLALKDRQFRIGQAILETSGSAIRAHAWRRRWVLAVITRCEVWAASLRGLFEAA